MYVIAGVTGHVGSVVAKELLAKKQPVKVIVRDAQKGASWSKQGAELAVGNLDDEKFLAQALKGAKALFTLLPPNMAAPDVFAYQKKTADTIANAVKAANVPHVVLLSSVGADLAEGTGPVRGLHYFENALRKTGTKLTAIRAGYFQENVGNVLGAVKQGIYPNFLPARDYPMPMIATKDIGHAAAQALVDGPKQEVIDLHGPAYSINQVIEKLERAIGKKLNVIDIPQPNWVGAMVQAGLPQPWAESFAEMYGAFAAGKVAPKGDRLLHGKTEIDETLRTLLG